MNLLAIEEPTVQARSGAWQSGHPLWALGFRPFYLLAAGFAALGVPLWVARFFGLLHGWPAIGLNWHMHEMVFGMAAAVVVGFLYTAGYNWTGLWTPRKGTLLALVALWLAGRVVMLGAPPVLAAIIDLLFLPCAAWPFYRVLRQSDNRRNLFLVALLCMLACANAFFHAADLGFIASAPVRSAQAAILVIVLIETVIGTRVFPMFTRNGAPGSDPVVRPKLDRAAIAIMVLAIASSVAQAPPLLTALLAGASACTTLVRLAGWKSHRTLRLPLLWILHVSYGWIAVGFLLLALASYGVVPSSAAFHALTVGSMAGLILGMMTRTSLGHTGRPLRAGRAETAMFWLIQLAALARVAAAIGPQSWYGHLLVCATLGWSSAFLLFVWVYAPFLTRARIDGREG